MLADPTLPETPKNKKRDKVGKENKAAPKTPKVKNIGLIWRKKMTKHLPFRYPGNLLLRQVLVPQSPSFPAPVSAHLTSYTAHLALDPAQFNSYPAHLALDPAQPNSNPAHFATDPAQPNTPHPGPSSAKLGPCSLHPELQPI
ncbi:hypothetical protein FKM82_017867 [Ascaphus truei]